MSSPVKTSKAFDLIDVKALEKSTPSPEKTRKPAMSKSDEFKIEGLIEVSDDDDDDDGGKSSKATGLSSFVEKLDPKTFFIHWKNIIKTNIRTYSRNTRGIIFQNQLNTNRSYWKEQISI